MTTKELAEIVKDRVKIESLFDDLQSSSDGYKTICPFHDDHRPSMRVRPDYGTYRCFACGAAGDVIEYVRQTEGVDFVEAVTILADRAGIDHDKLESGRSKSELYRLVHEVAIRYQMAFWKSDAARSYIRERKIPDIIAQSFGIGLSKNGVLDGLDHDLLRECGIVDENGRDRLLNRLIIPIRDWMGRPIAFGGRISPSNANRFPDAPKYINTPETRLFKKSKVVYGADVARKHAKGDVLVVEGYFDVIGLFCKDVKNVVAVMSSSVNPDQLSVIRRIAPKATLAFDGDEAGRKAAIRALPSVLSSKLEVDILVLPEGVDPGDSDDIQAIPRQDPFAYAAGILRAQHADTPEGTRRACEDFARLVSHVPQEGSFSIKVTKACERLAEEVGVKPNLLLSLVKPIRKPKETEEVLYDPLDQELLQCLVNCPILAMETRTSIIVRDPSLKPIVDEIHRIAHPSLDFHRILTEIPEDSRAYVSALKEDGDWELRGQALLRSYQLRDLRERIDALKESLCEATDSEKPRIREELSRVIKSLAILDKARI